MKVKVTVMLGVAIQNVELPIPDEQISHLPLNEQKDVITLYVNRWVMNQVKVQWEKVD